MLSGIGDPLELEALNIPVVQDLPDVGLHFQDHYGVSFVAKTNIDCPAGAHRDKEGNPPGGLAQGFLEDFVAQFFGFFRIPDQQIMFETFIVEGCTDDKLSLTFMVLLVTPSNEGRVIVESADPLKQARIEISPKKHQEDLVYLSFGLKFLYEKLLPALDQYEMELSPSHEFLKADERQLYEYILMSANRFK